MDWMRSVVIYIVLAVILVFYIYEMIRDIKTKANKGKILLTFKGEINGYLVFGEICILFILFMGEQVWQHKNTDIFSIPLVILFILLMTYCFYRGLRKPELYENLIIAPDGIYDLNCVLSYKCSNLMESEEVVVLSIKVEDKLLLGKSKIREIQFRLEKDKLDIIEKAIPNLRG